DAIAEYEVDLPVLQGHQRVVGAAEGHGFGGGEKLLQISLMAGATRHADLLSLHGFGADILEVALLASDEAGGRRIIAFGEVSLGDGLGVDPDRGDRRV